MEYKSIILHNPKVGGKSVCGNREVWREICVADDEIIIGGAAISAPEV